MVDSNSMRFDRQDTYAVYKGSRLLALRDHDSNSTIYEHDGGGWLIGKLYPPGSAKQDSANYGADSAVADGVELPSVQRGGAYRPRPTEHGAGHRGVGSGVDGGRVAGAAHPTGRCRGVGAARSAARRLRFTTAAVR